MSTSSESVSSGTHHASPGSISAGTLQPEEIISAFAYELERLAREANCFADHAELIDAAGAVDPDSEDGDQILSELESALQTFAPPYCYFGGHPGDGADFGFWLSESFQSEFAETDGLQVSDLSDVPPNFSGEVLHVNDHGNPTLYEYSQGASREIWAFV